MANLISTYPGKLSPETYPMVLAGLDLIQMLEHKQPAAVTVEFLANRDYVDMSTAYYRS